MTARVVCEGLLFPEGPVWHPEAGLIITEIEGQRVSLVRDGAFEVLAVTGGGANGMTLGPDGFLYVTNNGGIHTTWTAPDSVAVPGRVQRVTLEGKVEDFVTHVDGVALRTPNDCCFGPDGRLYFTDPRWELGKELETPGSVYRTDLDGRAELLAEGLLFTNGLAFDAAGQRLFVAASWEATIYVYPWSEAGLGEPEVFCRMSNGAPDGFCLAADGRLYVAATIGRGIDVISPEGEELELLPFDDATFPTNCCFAPDGTLYVTDSHAGRVLAFDFGVEGLPLR